MQFYIETSLNFKKTLKLPAFGAKKHLFCYPKK